MGVAAAGGHCTAVPSCTPALVFEYRLQGTPHHLSPLSSCAAIKLTRACPCRDVQLLQKNSLRGGFTVASSTSPLVTESKDHGETCQLLRLRPSLASVAGCPSACAAGHMPVDSSQTKAKAVLMRCLRRLRCVSPQQFRWLSLVNSPAIADVTLFTHTSGSGAGCASRVGRATLALHFWAHEMHQEQTLGHRPWHSAEAPRES